MFPKNTRCLKAATPAGDAVQERGSRTLAGVAACLSKPAQRYIACFETLPQLALLQATHSHIGGGHYLFSLPSGLIIRQHMQAAKKCLPHLGLCSALCNSLPRGPIHMGR